MLHTHLQFTHELEFNKRQPGHAENEQGVETRFLYIFDYFQKSLKITKS